MTTVQFQLNYRTQYNHTIREIKGFVAKMTVIFIFMNITFWEATVQKNAFNSIIFRTFN